MSLVKIGPKHQVVIPKEVFAKLRLSAGDYVEIAYENRRAWIRPKRVINREEDEPLGPETRAGREESLRDVKEGRVEGPFTSMNELLDHLKKKPAPKRKRA